MSSLTVSSPSAARRTHKARRQLIGKELFYRFFTFAYLAVLAFPLFWMLEMAFKRRIDITSVPPKIFFQPVLDNFVYLASHGDTLAPIERSLWISFLSVCLSLIIGAMAAFALARFCWFRQRDIEFFIVSTRMMPPVAVIIPYYSIFIQFHLLDNPIALAFVYLLVDLPLVIWLLLGFFRTIPRDLDNAARIDGANTFQVFWYIDLPLVKGGLVTAGIIAFLFTWGELFFAFILTSVNRTFPVALLSFLAVGLEVQYGPMAAAGIIAIIPSILMAVFARQAIILGFKGLAGVSE